MKRLCLPALLCLAALPALAGGVAALTIRDGQVYAYDASGSYRGTLHAGGCTRIQVVRGLIICHGSNGHATMYTANGSYCGSV